MTELQTCLWERSNPFTAAACYNARKSLVRREKNSGFLPVISLFSMNTAERKARSPHPSALHALGTISTGKCTLSVPLRAAPVLPVGVRCISKGWLCRMLMPAALTGHSRAVRASSCHIPLEKILTEIKSKQPIVLTNRVKESLPCTRYTLQTNF